MHGGTCLPTQGDAGVARVARAGTTYLEMVTPVSRTSTTRRANSTPESPTEHCSRSPVKLIGEKEESSHGGTRIWPQLPPKNHVTLFSLRDTYWNGGRTSVAAISEKIASPSNASTTPIQRNCRVPKALSTEAPRTTKDSELNTK